MLPALSSARGKVVTRAVMIGPTVPAILLAVYSQQEAKSFRVLLRPERKLPFTSISEFGMNLIKNFIYQKPSAPGL